MWQPIEGIELKPSSFSNSCYSRHIKIPPIQWVYYYTRLIPFLNPFICKLLPIKINKQENNLR